jgi:peroxiredoxin
MVQAGAVAPDFTLPCHNGPKVTLSQFRGKKNIVLAFYPLDWTPV